MQESRFMRMAATVGDLGSPFYREERQRDVWNEASAVGFQTMLWLSFVAGAAALWIAGRPALPYALTMAAVASVGSTVTLAYSRRLGVDPASGNWLTRARIVAFLVLYVAFIGGLLRAMWGTGDSSFERGLPVGFAVGLLVAIVMIARSVRKQWSAGPVDED